MLRVFLKPGEYHIANQPMLIETLVGSCVSVCLYNVSSGHAAMNHFLRDRPLTGETDNVGEFGTTSTSYIIDNLLAIDRASSHYRAQIIGGASVLDSNLSMRGIGEANVVAALETLKAAGIAIMNEDIGGVKGRRIQFDTQTGTVMRRFAGKVGSKVHWAQWPMRRTK